MDGDGIIIMYEGAPVIKPKMNSLTNGIPLPSDVMYIYSGPLDTEETVLIGEVS